MRPVTLVTGFFGVGKSSVAHRLGGAVIEDGYAGLHTGQTARTDLTTPPLDLGTGTGRVTLTLSPASDALLVAKALAETGGLRLAALFTVVDAANLEHQLDGPAGPLIRHQIGQAGAVLLSCTDLSGTGQAHARVAALSDAPIIETGGAKTREPLDPGPVDPGPLTPPPPGPAFHPWHYAGPAQVRRADLEVFLRRPPRGLCRLTGIVRLETGAAQIDLAGRRVSIAPAEPVPETRLTGVGLAPGFRRHQMDATFAQLCADGAATRGIYGYR